MYEWMGRAHASLVSERGQGTVEYVGLILLLAVLLTGVVTFAKGMEADGSIPKAVLNKLSDTIKTVGEKTT